MKRIVLAVALITLIVSAAPLRAEVPFDGEWKGKFLAQTHGSCSFKEKYFNAKVKNNQFVAVVDQESLKRIFERSIGKDRNIIASGAW